jgi:molybdopterin synthase sulfur carrier subunit
MARVRVLYFASLRDASGVAQELVETGAVDLRGLYLQLQSSRGLVLPPDTLRVAVDGEFARWSDPLREGSEVVFLPPVSGG